MIVRSTANQVIDTADVVDSFVAFKKRRASISHELLQEWILHSYDCVVKGLPKRVRDELKNS